MSFGSFLKGVGAQINPFDNGATYSTYNKKQLPSISQPQNQQSPISLAPQRTPGIQIGQPQNQQAPNTAVNNVPQGIRIRVGNTLADYTGPAHSWNTPIQQHGGPSDFVAGALEGAAGNVANLVGQTGALGGRFNPLHKTFAGESDNPVSNFFDWAKTATTPNNPNSIIPDTKMGNTGQRIGSDVVNVASVASAVKAIPSAVRAIRNIPSAISDVKSIGRLAKANTPEAVKAISPNLSDEGAQIIANTDNKDLIRLVHNLEVDKSLGETAGLTDNVAQTLEQGGITQIKKGDVKSAAYDPASNAILLSDGTQATPQELFHELGHSIYTNKLTDTERQAFENIHGTAYQQANAEGRTGYDLSSEDFADFMSKHLTGHDNLIPQEVLPIIKKYAPQIKAEAQAQGVPVQKVIQGLKAQTSPAREAASSVKPEDLSNYLNEMVKTQKGSLKDSSLLRRIEEKVNPAAPLSRIDKALAQSMGISHNDLPAIHSLENQYDIVRTSASQADRIGREGGLYDVLHNYPNKSSQQDFMNYLNARFASEVKGKRGIDLIRDAGGNPIPKETLDSAVANYEATHPNAQADAAKIKQFFDKRLQDAAQAGIISPEDAQFIAQYYQNYVPLERVFPDEFTKPQVNMRPVGTLGRQTVLQQLEGSDLPLNNDIATLFKRNTSIQSQINRNKLFNMYQERVNQGLVDGSKVIQSADQVKAREAAKARFNELQDIAKSMAAPIRTTKTQLRIAGKDYATAQKAGLDRAKELLKQTVEDPEAKAAISSMSKSDLTDVLKLAAEPDIQNTPNVQRIYNNLVRKGGVYQELADKLEGMKSDLGAVQSAKQAAREEAWSLGKDPTTGQQVIHGKEDGKDVILSVTPEVYRTLAGVNEGELNGVLKGFRDATRPFRAAWTGMVAPIFNLVSAAIYDPAAGFIISKNGTRALLSPSAWGAFFKSFDSSSEFRSALQRAGAQTQYGSLISADMERQLGRVVAQNGILSRAQFYANPKNIRQTINALDEFSGKLTAANRDRFAKAAYDAGIRNNMTHDEAMQEAVYAYNNVLPNFRRTSYALQQADAVLPYTGASVAGTRALGIAVRRRPAQTLGKLAALGVAPPVLFTLHNLSQPSGKEFYQDMQQSGKDQQLNTNWFIVTPWAHKDTETGQWTGVFKVPVPPELRALNKGSWQQTYDAVVNNKVSNPAIFAAAAFDTATGQVSPVTVNNQGKLGAQYGSSNPLFNLGMGYATNTNPQTGQPIVPESQQDLPASQQYTKSTSGLAKLAGRIGISPEKAQFALDQFGATGRIVQGSNPLQELKDRFTRVYGNSAGKQFFTDVANTVKSTGLNPNEQKAFYGSIMPSKTDAAGNILNEKTYYDSANKATTWLRYPKTFEVSKQLDAINRKNGEAGDPLFDLPPDRQKIVLNLMANYSPGNFESKAIEKLNPWVKDFYTARSAFFDKIASQNADELKALQGRSDAKSNPQIASKIQNLQKSAANAGVDPMGLKIPKASDQVQSLLDQVGKIEDSKQRAQFYKDHPDVTDFLAQSDAYQRTKRSFLALPQFDNYEQASPELQKTIDAYTALPKGTGARSAWIKANPGLWNQMTTFFDKSSAYSLARQGALAVYEGIDFPQSTLDKYGLSGNGSGSGSGFGFGTQAKVLEKGQSPEDSLSNNLKGSTAQKNMAAPKSKYSGIQFDRLPRGKVKKVNIPGIGLPNRAPTFKIGNSKQP